MKYTEEGLPVVLHVGIHVADVGDRGITVTSSKQFILSTTADVLNGCRLWQQTCHDGDISVFVASFSSQAAVKHLHSMTAQTITDSQARR